MGTFDNRPLSTPGTLVALGPEHFRPNGSGYSTGAVFAPSARSQTAFSILRHSRIRSERMNNLKSESPSREEPGPPA